MLIFAPAWTVEFWQGWVYLFVFAGSTVLVTAYLWQHDPKLLERRVNAGPAAEKEANQRLIQVFASLGFIGILVVPSLDHRFAWSFVPIWGVVVGNVFVAAGFFIIYTVFRANTFTAATIDVAPDQRVVSSGPYAVVRHPMYAGALVMLLGTPLALGSWWGLLMLIPMTTTIAWRLLDEERVLSERLAGYDAYRRAVRYRLIRPVW